MIPKKSLPTSTLSKEKPESQTSTGVIVIQQALLTMPQNPGVYRMINTEGQALYVGKARNLKKRVKAYTALNRLSERIRRMVFQTASLEIILTHSEAEALLLEANLIKKLKPRYNILLRDDKNYPWLFLGTDHPFPLLCWHHGAKLKKGRYFGPFASKQTVTSTVHTLQRIFRLRTCSDNVFSNRSRPCLLYQIKCCSAPCVGYITREEYALAVAEAETFLDGKSADLQKKLALEMNNAAEALFYEKAAVLRDKIKALTQIQSKRVVNPTGLGDTDVIALYSTANQTAIEVFFIRGGHNNGNRVFFPTYSTSVSEDEILSAFLAQFYSSVIPPATILLSHELCRKQLLTEALSLRTTHKVVIECPKRGEKKAVTEHALLNAKEALERKLAENIGQKKLFFALKELLQIDRLPNRIEAYDNSHIMGQSAYGVMVVATSEGLQKSAYRKFMIKSENITPGDDFGMMREVLTRRFLRFLKEQHKKSERFSETWQIFPDILLIDGGKGQVNAVRQVLTDLQLPEKILKDICLIGIAKGKDRNAGQEWFYIEGRKPFQLPPRDPVLFFLQRLRDEAHRFAITTHRAAQNKTVSKSKLDDIPQIGIKRKKLLLQHFGSVEAISFASLSDIAAVKGISKDIAASIYAYLHPEIRPLS